ncbi:hypothetical protein LZK76_36575 (plasmid) [Rhizobium leguminosarum]|nr:hypothetical protein LZK76_36575 [Rhizobium leguminosarum]
MDYLDAYPLNDYSIYGAVPLEELKRKLLDHKHAGTLDRVCLLILTNSTFDGIVCDPQARDEGMPGDRAASCLLVG